MKPLPVWKLPLLATILLLLFHCYAKNIAATLGETNRTETNRESASTTTLATELKVADRFLLAIPKSGFGKDYLFTASLIPQAQAATSTGLAAKLVRFELFPDGVDMYESTQGLVVTEDLPARRLLTTFTIVRQDASRVIIDFNNPKEGRGPKFES